MATKIHQKGDHGPAIRKVQQMLENAGHNLTIDGIYGAETASKVADFQKQQNLNVDGIAGPETLSCLKAVISEKQGQPVLKNGDEGEAVKQVQKLLQKAGFALSVDGVYGPETESKIFTSCLLASPQTAEMQKTASQSTPV